MMHAFTIAELRKKLADLTLELHKADETRQDARAGTVSGKRTTRRYNRMRAQLRDYKKLLRQAEK